MKREDIKLTACIRRCVTKMRSEWNPNIVGMYAEWMIWLVCMRKCREEIGE